MVDGLLNMRSRPYVSENLFDIPVDEGKRGMILPLGKRGGQTSFAFPQMALDAYQSLLTPYKAYSGELGMPSVDNPAFTDAATQFAVDFGLLPALGTAAIAKQSPNVLRMGMGGADTVSGGAVRGPEVDELGFYSQALETAKNLQQAKGTGEQFRKMLLSAGVKPDEIKFTPELEGLLSQPKVTRDEVVGLLQENRIRPEQTVLPAAPEKSSEGMSFPAQAEELSIDVAYGPTYIDDRTADMIGDDYYANYVAEEATSAGREDLNIEAMRKAVLEDDFSLLNANEDGFVRDSLESLVAEEYSYDPVLRLTDPDSGYEIVGSDEMGYIIRNEEGNELRGERYSLAEARIEAETDAMDRGIIGFGGGETRFMEYTEGGGDNYREMLLQVPEYAGRETDFTYSGHFDEPNIVVHARTKDRNFGVGDKGEGNTLYVEEMQSDWGQQGRQQGFDTPKEKQDLQSAMEQYEPFLNEKNKQNSIKNEAKRDFAKLVAKQIGGEVSGSSSGGSVYLHDKPVMNDYNAEEILMSGSGEIRLYDPLSGQYRQVSVTVPKEIKDKYKSSKKRWNELDEESKDLQKLIRKKADTPLAPFVGNSEKFAEVGIKRLINQAVKENKNSVVFSSGDVQYDRWNEEGLQTFYDKIIPKVGAKVAKRLDPDAYAGVKFVEDATGDVSGDRFVIQITPKMREKALEGQPLFNAPVAPLPATSLLGEDKPAMSPEQMYQAGII